MRLVTAAFLLICSPRVALACPVCFGQSDSPMALGINYGIYLMLGVIVFLWIAFASFFIYLKRRASLVDQPSPRLRRSAGALAAADVELSPAKAEGTV